MEWANKEGFFKAKVPREKRTAPDIGDVWIYGLTSGQKDDYENNVFRFTGTSRRFHLANARAQLFILTVHDQHGKRLFGENDIGRICEIPAAIVDPILDVARRLSGMAAGDIEQLVKNSQKVQAAESEDSDSD